MALELRRRPGAADFEEEEHPETAFDVRDRLVHGEGYAVFLEGRG